MLISDWTRNPLAVVTITLRDKGYRRYYVELRSKQGDLRASHYWAKRVEDMFAFAEENGARVVAIALCPYPFDASLRACGSFVGETGNVREYVQTEGDFILMEKLVEEKKRAAKKTA